MKAHYKTANGRITFEVSGETPKEVFAQIASVQEVFEAEQCCGVCQSPDIRYQHRVVDDFQFFELQCQAPGCRARFAFGQAKKGGALFPKRKDEDSRWLPNRGWERYVKPGAQDAAKEMPRYTKDNLPHPMDMQIGQECMYWDGKNECKLRVIEDVSEGQVWQRMITKPIGATQ